VLPQSGRQEGSQSWLHYRLSEGNPEGGHFLHPRGQSLGSPGPEIYRATTDLFLAQRFARHASPLTTACCNHPSDEELYSKIGWL
jgi:hypothetical protein